MSNASTFLSRAGGPVIQSVKKWLAHTCYVRHRDPLIGPRVETSGLGGT